jgi:hypothetical protein
VCLPSVSTHEAVVQCLRCSVAHAVAQPKCVPPTSLSLDETSNGWKKF